MKMMRINQMNKITLLMGGVLLMSSAPFAMEQPKEEMNFLGLPDEMKVQVLSYLEPKDLQNVSEVNWSLNKINEDESLWKNHCYRQGVYEKSDEMNWKSSYKDHVNKKIVRLTALVNKNDY
jgi:hypothetical protein